MSRGFGSTFGAGTTDAIQTSNSWNWPTVFSFSCWVFINGYGGTNAGRIFEASAPATRLFLNQPTTSINFQVSFSTTSGNFRIPVPGFNTWHQLAMTYDGSSVANTPSFYIDDVSQTVTTVTAPVGSITTTSGTHFIGASPTSGKNTFDGMLAHPAFWGGFLLAGGEVLTLSAGLAPIFMVPERLLDYLPLDGVNKPEFDFVGKQTLTITGTRLGASDPPVSLLSRYQNTDRWANTNNTLTPINFRRTLSSLGTRTGSRQAQVAGG